MIKFIKNRVVKSNSGISIIFAIIIIILMGLAGSVFAYLMASSSVNSRQDLTSSAAKYAAKSGIEIAAYELGQSSPPPPTGFSTMAPTGLSCPNSVVPPYGVSDSNLTQSPYYIYSYNLYSGGSNTTGVNNSDIGVDNYTPAFCAVVQQQQYNPPNPNPPNPPNQSNQSSNNCSSSWIITSNGFAGGKVKAVSAEVGICCPKGNCNSSGNNNSYSTIIFAENEVANNNNQ